MLYYTILYYTILYYTILYYFFYPSLYSSLCSIKPAQRPKVPKAGTYEGTPACALCMAAIHAWSTFSPRRR